MRLRSFILLTAGLGLLALAGWLATFPRPNPRPDLPEIAPFQPGDRLALILPDPGSFPAPDAMGLVQRARAAGAEVAVITPGDSLEIFQPTRIYQALPELLHPLGYHPDQWPARPLDHQSRTPQWEMLILSPEEAAIRNAGVLAAARCIRESGTDDARGSRELILLSRARQAEIWLRISPPN